MTKILIYLILTTHFSLCYVFLSFLIFQFLPVSVLYLHTPFGYRNDIRNGIKIDEQNKCFTISTWTNIQIKVVADVPWCDFFLTVWHRRLLSYLNPNFHPTLHDSIIVFPQKVLLSTAFQTFLTGFYNN